MIFQHESRGADKSITDAIDTHVQIERRKGNSDEDGLAGLLAHGLMARKIKLRLPGSPEATTKPTDLQLDLCLVRVLGLPGWL